MRGLSNKKTLAQSYEPVHSDSMALSHHHFWVGMKHVWRQFLRLLEHPAVLGLTFIGNVILFTCTTLVYLLERSTNPNMKTFLDALWWAVSTVTTVGYGDIVPLTTLGRLTGIALMFTGTVVFMGFVGLFASLFIQLELAELHKEVDLLRKGINKNDSSHHR